MWQGMLRSANSLQVRTLAFGLCLSATNIVRADEGIFWEATAPGRPVLILMPTIHMLDDEAKDISAVLYQALRRVNSVVIESPMEGETPAEKAAVHQRMTYPDPDSLENHVAVLSIDELKACTDKAHLPYRAAMHFHPFALTLLVAHRINGRKVHEGIDVRLYRGAVAGHRELSTLMTSVENIDYMGAMPQRLQELVLRHACEMLDNPGHHEVLIALADDWRRGDVDSFALDVEKPILPGDAPELLRANDFLYAYGTEHYFTAMMSERIQSMKGPILVAVGAGHYVGRYSVLPRLEKAGYVVRRVTLEELPIIPFGTNVATVDAGKQSNGLDH
ncbi:TraB/GumN family protein [Paraburkholderia saeva]|uniref:TraB/GumN family protein n=1 Tax=Paraburkholderia saeva TaxID=2777537 RepID=A0A9N8X056_9BURK|nr:TraB/GumN family protein [Paraburkholderia saeva]CAG4886717.1 hypothetical protein LMG31841_00248 [Paraburkholderia saeva]